MNNTNQKTVLAGIIGTVMMTLVTVFAPMMGMPKMSAPNMLAEMTGTSAIVGWIMHFMIGIAFAFMYTYLCIFKWKINNVYLKGVVFGLIVFILAQVVMAIMGAMVSMPMMEGSMFLIMAGSLIGHVIYGVSVSKTVGESYCLKHSCSVA